MDETKTGDPDRAPDAGAGPAAPEPLVCDFCGETVPRVRRVALDRDYDRILKPHTVQYACDSCSEAKERRRLGRDPG
jgi:hypothetical protein